MKQLVIDPVLRCLGYFDRLGGADRADDWSVIVPVCDQPRVTELCLESVARHAPGCELIVIDDGSKEPQTAEVIARHAGHEPCIVIRNQESQGHTEANRAGVEKSTRRYLCLLNSDAALTRHSFRLIAPVLERDDVGCVGPTTSQTSTQQSAHPYARWRRAEWSPVEVDGFGAFCRYRFTNEPPVELPYVGGFALCLSRATWDRTGGFDPKLPDYGNEKDLCMRLTRLGKKNLWVRASYVNHIGTLSYAAYGDKEIESRRVQADVYIDKKLDGGN